MEQDSSEASDSGLSRRTFVAGSAAGFATVSLAGCGGNGDGDTTTAEPAPDTEPEPDPTATDTEEPTATPEPQPENFVVTDDIIVSSSYVPDNAGFAQACSPSRMFAPGMHPVFKIGVYDPETGDHLTNDDLESVVVNIDGFDSVELAWSGDDEEHPADEWSGSWAIPQDTEPGTVKYTVEVTDGDANFTSVGILESSFTIIEYDDPVDYVITDDVYAGSAGIGDQEGNAFVSSCQPERQFAPNMMVGFDIGVFEASSGMPVSPPDFEWEESVQGPIDTVTVTVLNSDEEEVKSIECGWAGYEGDHAEKGADLYYNGVWHMENEDPPVEPGSYHYTIEVKLTEDASDATDSQIVGASGYNTFKVVEA